MVQHDGRRAGRRAGGRSYGEPDTVCPKHAPLLHTPAMVEAFRSPLAPDALAGQVAIVTGGGTGIGAATARAVVAAGGSVAICGRRPEPLAVVAEALGERCLARPCDVREPEQVAGFLDAVARAIRAVGRPGEQRRRSVRGPAGTDAAERDARRPPVERRRGLGPHPAGRHALDDPEPRRVHRLPGVQPAPGHPARSCTPRWLAARWRPSRRGSRSSGRSTGSGPCASPRDWCRPRVSSSTAAKRSSTGSPSRYRCAGRARPKRWPPRSPSWHRPAAAYITGTTVVVDGGADAWGMGERPPPLEP